MTPPPPPFETFLEIHMIWQRHPSLKDVPKFYSSHRINLMLDIRGSHLEYIS